MNESVRKLKLEDNPSSSGSRNLTSLFNSIRKTGRIVWDGRIGLTPLYLERLSLFKANLLATTPELASHSAQNQQSWTSWLWHEVTGTTGNESIDLTCSACGISSRRRKECPCCKLLVCPSCSTSSVKIETSSGVFNASVCDACCDRIKILQNRKSFSNSVSKACTQSQIVILCSDTTLAMEMAERRISRLEVLIPQLSPFNDSQELPEALQLVSSTNEMLNRVQFGLTKINAINNLVGANKRFQQAFKLRVIDFLSINRAKYISLQNTVKSISQNEKPIAPKQIERPSEQQQQEFRPSISSVKPIAIPLCGGTPLTITGEGFDSRSAEVFVDNIRCIIISRKPGVITVLSPPSKQEKVGVSVSVKNPGGVSDTLEGVISYFPNSFFDPIADNLPENASLKKKTTSLSSSPTPITYTPGKPPIIEVVNPAVCGLTGGTVQILGSNLSTDLILEIDSIKVEDVVVTQDGSAIVFNSPPLPAGFHSIQVRNPDGLTANLDEKLYYLGDASPLSNTANHSHSYSTSSAMSLNSEDSPRIVIPVKEPLPDTIRAAYFSTLNAQPSETQPSQTQLQHQRRTWGKH